MMQSVVDSGTARRLRVTYNLQNDIAGKTGTTQSHADGWFIGFTPNLVAGAWVGGESPKVHFRSISLGQGANTALPIFGKFMQSVYKDAKFKKMQNAKFDELDFGSILEMDCPPYLEEEPELVEIIEEESFEEDDEPLDRILDIFKNRKKRKDEQQPKGDAKSSESEIQKRKREESERIKKKNEQTLKNREKEKKRAERKKKRREKWDKLFGKKN